MVKVSHEVPICLLNKSRDFNDYDYCLPHLLDKNLEYEEYFRDAREKGRYIIMDNSLHELGKAYDKERLLHWIKVLKPNEFIIPDVWENMEGSVKNAEEWINIQLPEGVEKVAVIQADTINEAFNCTIKYKELGYKKLAYSYGASYYNEIHKHPNLDFGKALGRVIVISTLYSQNVLTNQDRVHLLGCAVPQEFGWYNRIDCIESIDTSNPIMSTLEGIKYFDWGLEEKPVINITDSIEDVTIDDFNKKILKHNIEKFRKINYL